jgi:16S rRNA (guanine(966)-N(2))-methyltransferase RsmD
VRIIAGRYRRTPIGVVDAPGLRPTPDRVRETLFNWLEHLQGGWTGVRALDLFAGSGALGLECASRGAQQVVLVEHHARAAAALRELLQRLDGAPAVVVQDDWQAALARLAAASFDLVLLDPPFDAGVLARAIAAALRVLRPGGLLYVESGQPLAPADLAAWPVDLLRSGRAGAVFFHLLRTRAC